jgi:hypothetical protein
MYGKYSWSQNSTTDKLLALVSVPLLSAAAIFLVCHLYGSQVGRQAKRPEHLLRPLRLLCGFGERI